MDGAALDLGRGVHDGAVAPAAAVRLPLRMVNRHGLIAGATGTGKTKSLQGIAEQLSAAGALGGGVAAVGAFLQPREGKQVQKTVMRGVVGMLKKKL